MKTRHFLLIIFLSIISFSCKNRDEDLSNERYIGTWKWISTDGGVGNIHDTPTSTGIIRTLTFTSDNHYTVTENNAVVSEGTYNLIKGTTSTDHLEKVFIDFSNYPDVVVNSVSESDLYTAIDSADGYTYHYAK